MKTFVRTILETITFSRGQWDELSDQERETWTPQDGTDEWPPEPEPKPKETMEEAQRRLNKSSAKFMMEHLRLKEGNIIPFAGGKYKVLRWGSKQHLVHVKYNSGTEKYALMPRLVEDSSYGLRDIVKEYPVLNHLPDLETAEAEYIANN